MPQVFEPITIVLDSIKHATSVGGSDGKIYISISGGAEPFDYQLLLWCKYPGLSYCFSR